MNVKNEVKIDMILSFPQMFLQGQYELILGLFGFPLYSNGQVYTAYSNLKVQVSLRGHKYLRNGVEYIRFDPIYFKYLNYNVDDIKFSNLFEESLFIGRILYSYIILNKEYVTSIVNPDFEKTFSQIFTKIANQIADMASFDELFPR